MRKENVNIIDFFKTTDLKSLLVDHDFHLYDYNNRRLLKKNDNISLDYYCTFNLEYEGEYYGNFKLNPDVKLSQQMIDHKFKHYLNNLKQVAENEQNRIIIDDLVDVLERSEDFSKTLADLIEHLLCYLRSHICCKDSYFFSIFNEHTLKPIIGFDEEGKKHSSMFDTHFHNVIANIAATTKKIFICNDVTDNKELIDLYEGDIELKNFAAFPILYKEDVIGVYLLLNKISNDFNERDNEIIRKFSKFSSHILKEKFYNLQLSQAENLSSELSKYISGNVSENIKEKGLEDLGGVEKYIVVMFVVIQDFEKIMNLMLSKDLVPLLNYYYEQLYKICKNYDGTLDKIITPALMIVWNHPHEQKNAEELALKCAIELQQYVKSVLSIQFLARGIKSFSIGIGINSGFAIAGNIGCNELLDYTVIGDIINTGQRLEANSGKGEILVHRNFYKKIYGDKKRDLDTEVRINAKGKSELILAYKYFEE